MKIIDKFILGNYLKTFFFCLLLFMVIVVVVDISEKTDDFAKPSLTINTIITQYYFGFMVRMAAMLFPLFVFISVIFFTSKMAARSEVIAILSSGVSFVRYSLPFFAGAAVLAALLWVGGMYLVPRANYQWANFEKRYLKGGTPAGLTSGTYKQDIYFRLDSNGYIGINGYDTATKVGNGFFLQRFRGNQLIYNLRANSFSWDTAKFEWKLNDVTERYFNQINEAVSHNTFKSVKYNFRPVDLGQDEYLKDQMTTPELNRFIEIERFRNGEMLKSLLVERYNRDALPVAVFILTAIGVGMASRKVRGGSGVHLALGMVLCVVYILFSRFSSVFATKGDFSPLLAAWTPNIIFSIVAVYVFYRAAR